MTRPSSVPDHYLVPVPVLSVRSWRCFLTEQLGAVFKLVDEDEWPEAFAWNFHERSPAQVDVLGAASLKSWQTDGTLPEDLIRLRCAVIHARDVDGPEADGLVRAAIQRMRAILDNEHDGPSEPLSEEWVKAGYLQELRMGTHVREHFEDSRLGISSFEFDDHYYLAVLLGMHPDLEEFTEWEREHLERCHLLRFADPFTRTRYRWRNLPTHEFSLTLRSWQHHRAAVFDDS